MQPQCGRERHVRRTHYSYSQSHSDCFLAITSQLDGKPEKSSSPSDILVRSESSNSLEVNDLLLKTVIMEQTVRKHRAMASYCFLGLLFLLLFFQALTGGFSLVNHSLKDQISRTKQAARRKSQNVNLHVAETSWRFSAIPSNKQTNRNRKDARQIIQNDVIRNEAKVHVKHSSVIHHVNHQGDGKTQIGNKKQQSEGLGNDVWKNEDLLDGSLLWSNPSPKYYQCISELKGYKRHTNSTNGYLVAFANGGLNQMRTAICDMVAVARILNATLVIPELDHDSFWDDPSKFEDIFNMDHFIRKLKHDINIVKELPAHLGNIKILELAPRSWSEVSYYEHTILPLLVKHKVVRFSLTDSRLANNGLPNEIQRLRCKANYEALVFSHNIQELGGKIIKRLQERGSYIALHLRYEKDMLAFSGCTIGLSSEEALELKSIRYNTSRWKEKEIDPVRKRSSGECPLTPLEIAFLLRAMGYPPSTTIYVAAGQIYGGKRQMKSFTNFFPNVVTKETIATQEELKSMTKFQNRLAGIDYMVAVESDLFVPTYDGNMARTVQGHRRFKGHKKTLVPDRRRVVKIFDAYHSGQMDWHQVQLQIQKAHQDRQGSPHYRKSLPPLQAKKEENFYANPLPGCICEVPSPVNRS